MPDIDFNIRAGNTLVGFVSVDEIRKAAEYDVSGQQQILLNDTKDEIKQIEEDAGIVELAFKRFHEMQTEQEMDAREFKAAKENLQDRLKELTGKLNKYLAKEYSIDLKRKKAFEDWRSSHRPFHWFVEFYGIMSRGGFDVIIGNPPYLNTAGFKTYTLRNFKTLKTRNLYPIVLERCQFCISGKGRQGYIVPVSSISTEGYASLQSLIMGLSMHISSYDDRPSHLFEGLDKNTLSILLLSSPSHNSTPTQFASRIQRWNADERETLFSTLQYSRIVDCPLNGCIPKIGSAIENNIWLKLLKKGEKLSKYYSTSNNYITYYSRKVNAFLQVLDFIPEVHDGDGNLRLPSEFKTIKLRSKSESSIIYCILNSTLFRWFIDVVTDGSHINRREIDNFPFNPIEGNEKCRKMTKLSHDLTSKLKATSEIRVMRYKHDTLTVQCIIPKFSKSIINEIDQSLVRYYGFSEEELDFIINYDIKYT